jgi:hypothetical protein
MKTVKRNAFIERSRDKRAHGMMGVKQETKLNNDGADESERRREHV